MWANLLKILIAEILLPLIKDGVFMLVNFFKVRQLRKEQEEKKNKQVEAYEKSKDVKSAIDDFSKLP